MVRGKMVSFSIDEYYGIMPPRNERFLEYLDNELDYG